MSSPHEANVLLIRVAHEEALVAARSTRPDATAPSVGAVVAELMQLGVKMPFRDVIALCAGSALPLDEGDTETDEPTRKLPALR